MTTKQCPYCGDSHLDIAMGEHLRECKKTHKEPIYSLKHIEARITELEKRCK